MKIGQRVNSLEEFRTMIENERVDQYSNSYESLDGTVMNITELYDGVERDINNLIFVTFSDKEARRYMYNPKLLAFDCYGNTELFWTINSLNNVNTAGDLTEDKLLRGLVLLNKSGLNLLEELQITPQRIELFDQFRF